MRNLINFNESFRHLKEPKKSLFSDGIERYVEGYVEKFNLLDLSKPEIVVKLNEINFPTFVSFL
jgi:hypothetical protein